MKKKILVHCPADSTTGGPEALHQFCSEAQKYLKCEMCYYLNNNAEVPKKFDIYKISKSNFFDDENTMHIIPEISTKYFINKIFRGKIIIFWLSVDNFFNLKDRTKIKNLFYYFLSLFTHRKPMVFLKNYIHISQSEYSNSLLKKNNFKFSYVGDYIRDECYDLNFKKEKENFILYNPKKGMDKLLPIIEKLKNQYKFIPLENLSSIELKNMLQISKIYIDFGRMPGKDRIPREAVLNDCCLIIGKRGAGLNKEDFSIDEKFKINLNSSNYFDKTQRLLVDIMQNYYQNLDKFKLYKIKTLNEKLIFKTNVKNFIENEII